jgi:Arc/MetJ-type ribon-helix-helix transcriptional regulator
MKTFKIKLPDDLAKFVEETVAAGDWVSADVLIETAIAKLRSECLLAGPSRSTAPTAPDIALPPIVDTKRQSFDSPKFIAELMDKLWVKK